MGLIYFLLQRIIATIPLLIGISIVSFGLILAIPGDYVDLWLSQTMAQTGQSRTELQPQADALRAELGLDKPVWIQYYLWIKGIVTSWDFGYSFFHSQPVTEVIGNRLPRSIGIAIITLIVGQFVGAVLGIYAAMNQYKLGDTLATIIAFLGIVIPKFVMALVILYFLAFVWHSPYIGALNSPNYVIQDYWNFGKLWDFFKHVWPILFISIWAGQAYTLRMMRGNLLDVMNSQYVETARAKGLSHRQVIFLHAIPNALHPVIMNMGTRFDYMIKGELEIAIVLGIPTIGPLILGSIATRDMLVIAAIFMIIAVIIVIGNLVADLLLAILDPRVRQATLKAKS
ncbi:MAG: ABC transporter permease [Rhodobacteraceae bacterium]|nr:ABC transporter permease [Paracoccaceae bacterium]MCY4251379.1 ABC transporter permease [Paracoccaceae bacterium]MCY4309119.1 ABC transporter permease [Paracoccaceae bacterium]